MSDLIPVKLFAPSSADLPIFVNIKTEFPIVNDDEAMMVPIKFLDITGSWTIVDYELIIPSDGSYFINFFGDSLIMKVNGVRLEYICHAILKLKKGDRLAWITTARSLQKSDISVLKF